MHAAHRPTAVAAVLLALIACRSGPEQPYDPGVADLEQPGLEATQLQHKGPGVTLAPTGTGRFAGPVLAAFDRQAALASTAALEALHRIPGNADFERGLEHLASRLAAGGFGHRDGLELEWIETPLERPGWAGHSGSVTLIDARGGVHLLHAFERSSDRDRSLLPIGAPSAEIEGRIRLELGEIEPGDILVSDSRMRRDLITRAKRLGAVALVCGGLEPYNMDPTGAQRHLDAVQLRTIDHDLELPVAHVSPRSYSAIRAALEVGDARLRLSARTELSEPRCRTLVARIRGAERAREAVVLVSQGGGPGAINNASGAAGLTEGALTLARLIEQGRLPRPARTLVFLVGPEMAGTRAWLAHTDLSPVAAVNLVMIGSSPSLTGAICLLERHPDPGARHTLPPDEHTQWGFRPPEDDWLVPNGLAIVARCALADVSLRAGGWKTAENPYEGGTDHEVLLAAGVPTVLYWHFTDFTFYTSLDRLEMVDGDELMRTAAAGLTAALAIADPKPTDLDRYLATLNSERRIRIQAARDANRPGLEALWSAWFDGARMWLRAHCLGLEPPAPVPLPPLERRPGN